MLFRLSDIKKSYSAHEILRGVSFQINPNEKVGLVGRNGAGKTTVFRLITGEETADAGEIIKINNLKLGLLEQHVDFRENETVHTAALSAFKRLHDIEAEMRRLEIEMATDVSDEILERYAELQIEFENEDGFTYTARAEAILLGLGFAKETWDAETGNLSGGQKNRLGLARLLLSQPDILLLDEPTNHLDAESVAWLERFLADYRGTVVAVTHDRYFLDNVAGWILELDRGRGVPYRGNYSGWLEQKQARLAAEEKQESAHRRALARELEWVRASPQARHAKSKARLAAYERLLAQERDVALDRVEIHIPAGPRLGDLVVEAERLRKGYGDRLLVEDLTFSLPPGGIVGVIGPNGAGKTTLFRMIAGEEEPDAGTLRLGESVQLAYVDQSRAGLDPESTVWKEISGGEDTIALGSREVNSRQYVSWFNFRGPDQQKRVEDLSGGERNRLHLAKLLRSGGNVLLLDEPTNDLDVDTLRALEDALLDFAGCAVVISHDRWFLDRVATHVLAFVGDSQVDWFEGAFSEYEDWVRETRGAEALEPHRIRYKPLVRAG